MEKNITVSEFLNSKEITPTELKENFTLVKTLDIDMNRVDHCVVCNDTCNQQSFPSSPWTYVSCCHSCKYIILTFCSDRMGGNHTDTVLVYEQKNRPMYELYYKCEMPGQKYGDAIKCRICNTESFDKEDIENKFCKTCNKKLE